tara:strand:- start:316 stop:609 length:294 start_codon:yes stop_codon:yes gene_type:complete
MTKNEIIKLYIGDLKSKVTETDARNNRIEMLESELETTKPVNVDLADITPRLLFDEGLKYAVELAKDNEQALHVETAGIIAKDYAKHVSHYLKNNVG